MSSEQGGGVAYLGSICTTNKARGVTGSGAPIGDPFDIDYVAHEMGHQFGGNHTFRAIQVHAAGMLITLLPMSRVVEALLWLMQEFVDQQTMFRIIVMLIFMLQTYRKCMLYCKGTDCSVKTPNNNLVPTADAGADYIIPNGTAFVLTGTGTDPNGDPITYLWEQYDNTSNTQPPVSTATAGLCIVLCCRQLLLQDIFRC
jgi:hypothetical protein